MGNSSSSEANAEATPDAADDWQRLVAHLEIKAPELHTVKNISKNAKGTVDVVEWRGDLLASKTLKATSELRDMLSIRPHSCILRVRGYVSDPEMRLLTDYLDQGDLEDFVCSDRPYSFEQLIKILRCIALALNHVSKEGYVYRDLALRNVLLDLERGSSNLRAVLADLGWMIKKGPNGTAVQPTNSAPWRITAPEALNLESPAIFSEKSDVWSFGVCLYSLLTRKRPYEDIKSIPELRQAVHDGRKLVIDPAADIPSTVIIADGQTTAAKQLIELMDKCFIFEYTQRPSFADIIAALDAIEQSILAARKG